MTLVCAEKLKYKLEYKDLIKYTNNFSEQNYIGDFQFGEVYRGKIEQTTHETLHVFVKIWKKEKAYNYREGDNESILMHEIRLLRHEKLKNHPWSLELYGYCWENDHLGIVYNLKPLDTVRNLAPKNSFTWLQRIKVAIGFARHLKFLHMGDPTLKPFVVRNISSAHIVLDEEYNPMLFDFSMISGGILPDRTIYQRRTNRFTGRWEKPDVYAFGYLLLILIMKSKFNEECWPDGWLYDNYKGSTSEDRGEKLFYSFVDPSLEMDPDFSYSDGRKITKLAVSCIMALPHQKERPRMKRVWKILSNLQVVKKNTKFLGLDPKLQDGVDG